MRPITRVLIAVAFATGSALSSADSLPTELAERLLADHPNSELPLATQWVARDLNQDGRPEYFFNLQKYCDNNSCRLFIYRLNLNTDQWLSIYSGTGRADISQVDSVVLETVSKKWNDLLFRMDGCMVFAKFKGDRYVDATPC